MKRIMTPLSEMGADITYINENCDNGEPTADLLVKTSSLHGVTVEGDIIPTFIDEIPMIAVVAAFAQGTTVIKDAAELKVKESNRINTVVNNLKAMGCDIEATDDVMIIHGGKTLHGATIVSKKDHRIAMSFAIGALAAEVVTEIMDAECVNISYLGFYEDIERLSK